MMIESPTSVSEDIQEELRRAQPDRRAFNNSAERATHLRLFFAWLPKILQDAPGIPWDQLPSQAMGHLVRTVADHPDASPPLPARFLERYAQHRAAVIAATTRRKEQSDVLTPLLPLLLEVAQFRKQAMERLYKAFCHYRDQADAGVLSLPYRFQYAD